MMNQSELCKEFKYYYDTDTTKCEYRVLQFSRGYDTVIDLFRLIMLLFYIIWIIIAIKIKAFHKRQMIFVHNLVVVCTFSCVTALWPRLWSTCYIPSQTICILVQWTILYGSYNSYAIGGLILHRLACIIYHQKVINIKFAPLLLYVLLTWLIPALLSVLHILLHNGDIFYHRYYGTCFINTYNRYESFWFFLIFGNIIPITIMVIAYTYAYYKLNLIKISNRRKEPLRVTLQIVVLIAFYIFDCIGSLFGYYPCFVENSRPIIVYWLRIIKLLHHICYLNFTYFHPILMKKYRKFFN
jgi:hypothetical protein